MSRNQLRRRGGFAAALAIASGALVAAAPPASASLPGGGNVLTIGNSSSTVRIVGDPSRSTLTSPVGEAMRDVSWSPDGSRMIYLSPDQRIRSVRWTGAASVADVAIAPIPGNQRAGTSWVGDGSSIVWAEKWDFDQRWTIRIGPSTWSVASEQISPYGTGKHYRNPDGGPNGLVVFQREDDDGAGNPTGRPAVMLYDPRKPDGNRVTVVSSNGANPALSPDGTRVAFVRDGQIVVSDLTGGSEWVVAGSPPFRDNPTWSPDGWTIAYSQEGKVGTVGIVAGDQPKIVSDTAGVPAYQPRNVDRVARLSGSNRFTTGTAISRSHWASAADQADPRERARTVVLSRSDTFADALGGSALAAAKHGPLLLTPPTALQADTAAELTRVLAPGGTVYLLGSPGALSTQVADQVTALGYQVRRLAGPDRFATAVAIAREMRPEPDNLAMIFVATGMDFPDALAAGAAARNYDFADIPRAVVVLTNDGVMPQASRDYLDSLGPDLTIFGIGRSGAQAAKSYDTDALEVLGDNRFDTASQVAKIFFEGQRYAGVATGLDWPDALAGGALMGTLDGPLLLTPGTATDLGVACRATLDETSGAVRTGVVFGSAGAVTDRQLGQVGTWLGGPAGARAVVNPTDLTGFRTAPALTARADRTGSVADEKAEAARRARLAG
ncbi:cell wall-binding repeat-containing protein [Micromonospora sp. NPDC050495]|uniref:cell wall-binding repeat-containing protein n=1 Tax=Micromonospora sp. NPDC050495 TaxID=3154936 RepID=UPI0033F34759